MATMIPAFTQHHQTTTNNGIHHESMLIVPTDSIRNATFDTVHVILSGCVRSTLGATTTTERLISLTDTKVLEDFMAMKTSTSTPSAYQTTVSFQVPSKVYTSNGKGDGQYLVLPSSSINEGTTYITRSTALSDRQVVKGSCEVLYWLEARFLHEHSLVHRVTCPITLSLNPSAAHLGSFDNLQDRLQFHAKPALMQRCWSKASNDLTVTLSNAGLVSEPKTSNASHRTFPLSVSVSSCGASVEGGLQYQSLHCTVEAHWETLTRFSGREGSHSSLNIARLGTSSTQKSVIEFPPLCTIGKCSGSSKTSSSATTSDIFLELPDSISAPSVSTDLFSKSYTLDLTLRFTGAQQSSKYFAHAKVPITFSHNDTRQAFNRQSSSTSGSGFDVFGFSATLEAPPPYIE